MRVLLFTTYAPYLGGPSTWKAVTQAAPEFSYELVDALDFTVGPNIRESMADAFAKLLPGTNAVVAHGPAVAVAMTAVARVAPEIPIVVLAPKMFTRDRFVIRVIRTLFSMIRRPLNRYARKKLARLRADRAYVRKQIALLVAPEYIDEALIDEAMHALADPRLEPFVDRTGDALVSMLSPLYPAVAEAKLKKLVVGDQGAPMIERPHEVAAALRDALSAHQSLNAMSS